MKFLLINIGILVFAQNVFANNSQPFCESRAGAGGVELTMEFPMGSDTEEIVEKIFVKEGFQYTQTGSANILRNVEGSLEHLEGVAHLGSRLSLKASSNELGFAVQSDNCAFSGTLSSDFYNLMRKYAESYSEISLIKQNDSEQMKIGKNLVCFQGAYNFCRLVN